MTPQRSRYIRSEAENLLRQAGITSAPISVEDVAACLGAEVCLAPVGGEVSGMLYREGGRPVIGVNASHPRTRQRFTIAHEIGHLVLHRDKLHVDRNFPLFRNERSTQGADPAEIEANAFAAELLMPTVMLEQDIWDLALEYSEDEMVEQLAERYHVSKHAMTIRLANLGYISPID